MGTEEINLTNMHFPALVIDSILDCISSYQTEEFEKEINEIKNRFKTNDNLVNNLEEGEKISLQTRGEFLEDSIRLLEIFNALKPLRDSGGNLQKTQKSYTENRSEGYTQKFANLELNSKASLGFEILFRSPPEEAALLVS